MDLDRIPEPDTGADTSLAIPVTASQVSQDTEDPEAVPYSISFVRYRPDECQITGIGLENAKAALTIFRDVGVHFSSVKEFLSNETSNVEVKNVVRDGAYMTLFSSLGDEEVKEIKLVERHKNIDLRIFFFSLDTNKTFYVLALKEDHLDTDKGTYNQQSKREKKRLRNFFKKHR